MTTHLLILAAALIADRLFGDPDAMWNRVGHPVVWMGRLIAIAETRLNRDELDAAARYRNGAIAFAIVVAIAFFAATLLVALINALGLFGWLIEGFAVYALLAQKSLRDHVTAVETALRDSIVPARKAIGSIVGRNPETLDRHGIARAAIESLAENFSDGVVAPAFWYAIFGLPGIAVYKMINTADSMIGHRTDRYLAFGNASARADDLANWLPARLSALLIAAGAVAVSGTRAGLQSLSVAMRDSGLHRSPNAGWPEAAMAGAGDFALGGPRRYGGEVVAQSWINAAGNNALGPACVSKALRLFDRSCDTLLVVVVVLFTAII